jgi:hypothetical protein
MRKLMDTFDIIITVMIYIILVYLGAMAASIGWHLGAQLP